MIAAALERGDRGRRRARAGLAGDPQPLPRRHRDQRQDDRRRAARPRLRDRRRAGRRRRQRRHAALLARRRGSSPTRRSICEASSFQLEDSVDFAPECAVFLNLAPDHLDRHRDLESYLAAKLRIFANQGNDDVAVYNADEPALAGVDLGGCARRISFCVGAGPDCEVALRRGHDLLRRRAAAAGRGARPLRRAQRRQRDGRRHGGALDGPRPRRGRARACAASPASRTGSSRSPSVDGVRFVNDSKATNVASATVGLRAFEGGVHAILGGSDKGEDFAPLVDAAARALRAPAT